MVQEYDHTGNPITLLGSTTYRNQERIFGIKRDDRRRHMYILGKTGMGKSTILENMIIDDIRQGNGVGVIDPHGELAEKILEYIPTHRINDVVYFNPSDLEYPIAFNILESADPRYKHLVASGLMGVFKKIWPDVWSARMEYIMNNTILALLDYPETSMLGINRMLSDKVYRQKVVDKITDPVVRAFWVDEFGSYTEKFATEAIAPIQNKVGQFLASAIMRNIVGQVKSTIDIRKIMDERKIFIMNLSKGRVGEDGSRLLGGMLITKIQLCAMSRVDIPESERADFFLYVDEFQNFATESFANILSEARKYRLALIVAHQYIAQLDEKVRDAVFGNVGTMVTFRVGASDADYLVKEFTPRFIEEDLVNIAKFHFYLKLMIDGASSEPFSARGLPPLTDDERTHNVEKVIAQCRERYAVPRAIVEDRIDRWSRNLQEQALEAKKNEPEDTGKKKKTFLVDQTQPAPDRPYEATCSRCQKKIFVAFQPDGKRPVYCRECYNIVRQEKEQGITSSVPVVAVAPAPTVPMSSPKPSAPRKDFSKKPFEKKSPHPQAGGPLKTGPMNMKPVAPSLPEERISLSSLKPKNDEKIDLPDSTAV